MYKAINLKSNLVAFGTPLLIMLKMVFITKSALFKSNPDIGSFGVTFDLLLTTPLIYYLLIRKKNIPKITIVSFFLSGIALASLILPPENQYFLSLAKKWILPLAEATILITIIYKGRKTLRLYRKNKSLSVDFFTIVKHTCGELLPRKAAVALATEIALVFYGFFIGKNTTSNKMSLPTTKTLAR
jgi:K+ transporter